MALRLPRRRRARLERISCPGFAEGGAGAWGRITGTVAWGRCHAGRISTSPSRRKCQHPTLPATGDAHAGPRHGAFQATGMAVRVQARARPTGFVLKAPWKCADRACLRMLHCIVAIFDAF